LHAVEGVHGGQLGDLATDAVELPVFLGQQLTNVAYEVLSRVLHASISLASLVGRKLARVAAKRTWLWKWV
jgi:hypothetical protein